MLSFDATAGTDGEVREVPSSSRATPLGQVEIIGEGSLPPLIYLHCWPGDVANSRELSRGLTDRQLISLPRPTGPSGRAPSRFDDWVRHYNHAIEDLGLTGPIYLAGWSMAFRFVIEVAAERSDLGQRTDLLISLDGNGSRALQEAALSEGHRRGHLTDPETGRFVRALGLRRRNRRYLQARAYRALPLRLRKVMSQQRPDSIFWHASREHVSAIKVANFHHRNERRTTDVAAVVVATRSSQDRMGDGALGLRTQLLGDLEVATVPGRHLTILDADNGPVVAAVVDQMLRAADERFALAPERPPSS